MVERHRTCVHCGAGFSTSNKVKIYCSKACGTAAWRQDNLQKVRLWSERARDKEQESRAPFSRVTHNDCKICGRGFWSAKRRYFCMRDCELEHGRRQGQIYAAGKKDLTPHLCKQCGVLFVAEYGNGRRVFCSDTCVRKNHNKTKPRGTNAHRAKLAGVERRYFNELRIFERDKWRCRLCGRKTPMKLRGTYEDAAPELDHVIPLSKGGGHVQENVQCTCRRCNLGKGDRPMGQLWLFGIADTRVSR